MSKETAKKTPLNERLKLARELAGLSQGQVAQKLGLHRPAISEMEAGRRKVSAEELPILAETYGVTVAWLTGSEGEATTKNNARVELAARELAKLDPADLDRILQLLSALRTKGAKN